jgi:superfamily I DNA/RNA helicase
MKLDFRQWMTAQHKTNFYKAFTFEGVSTYELKGLLEGSSRKELGDAFYLEIKEEILGRVLETNRVIPQQPEQPAPMKKWIYSKIVKPLGELQIDDDVGVSKAREGVWDVVHLDTNKRAFTSEQELASYVKSVRNGTAPIVAGSIEELRKVAGEFRARQAPSPKTAEVAPEPKPTVATNYILSTMKIASGGFKAGDKVAVSKGEGDNWTITPLAAGKKPMSVPKADLASFVKSDRDENDKPISSTSLEELKKMISDEDEEEKKEEPATTAKKLPSGRLPDHKMSRYNRDIEEAFLGGNQNIVINALAGTGKTTMLKHLASYKKPGERWLYLVFNKKNQVEATKLNAENERPFPPGVEVLTTHSFLGRLLDNNGRSGKFQKTELHDGKGQSPKLAEMLDDDWFKDKATRDLRIPWKKVWPLKMRVKDLVSKGKAFNADPRNSKAAMNLLDELIDKYNIDTTLLSEDELEQAEKDGREVQDYRDEVVDMSYDVLRRMAPDGSPKGSHYSGTRDHDDTLWWAALHADELQWPRFDVVLADEVQDFNKNQQVMLKKLNEAGARIIAVGDPWQAIYRFRGADNDAFGNVEKIAHGGSQGGKTLMLPINFRSGKKIIDFANSETHMKDLDDEKRLKSGMSHDGEVTTHKMYSDVMDTIHDEWDTKGELSMPTAILARNNAPLLATAMGLLKRGIPFQIIGREFLDEINKFIRRITGIGKNAENYPIEIFRERMNEYVAKKEEEWHGKAKKQGELEEMITISDSLNGVLSYLEQNGWYDPQDSMRRHKISDAYTFLDFLKNRFGGLNVQENDNDAEKFEKIKDKVVSITTGHRSKGLEFDRVFIIRNDLYETPKGDNPEEIQQERNSQYVAYTRAKKELHVISDKEPS